MMATLLDLKGYSVVTAANGAEALRVARQQLPCLILLDLIMPVMDGLQFRAEQLADAALSSIPVVCVSGALQRRRPGAGDRRRGPARKADRRRLAAGRGATALPGSRHQLTPRQKKNGRTLRGFSR